MGKRERESLILHTSTWMMEGTQMEIMAGVINQKQHLIIIVHETYVLPTKREKAVGTKCLEVPMYIHYVNCQKLIDQ